MNWDFATSLRSVEWHAEAVKLWEAAQESEHLQMTQELLQQGLHECLEIIFLAVMASLGALFFERVQRGVERTAAQQAEKEPQKEILVVNEVASAEAHAPAAASLSVVASPQRVPRPSRLDPPEPLSCGGLVEAAERHRARRSSTPVPRAATAVAAPPEASDQEVLNLLNSCNNDQLYQIYGVGPVMVNRILIQRRQGGFSSIQQVRQVLGGANGGRIVNDAKALLRRGAF